MINASANILRSMFDFDGLDSGDEAATKEERLGLRNGLGIGVPGCAGHFCFFGGRDVRGIFASWGVVYFQDR